MVQTSGARIHRGSVALLLILMVVALLPAARPVAVTAATLGPVLVVPNASAGPGEDTLVYVANTGSGLAPLELLLRLHRPDGTLIAERTIVVPDRQTSLIRVSSFITPATGVSVSGVLVIHSAASVEATAIHQKDLGTSGFRPTVYRQAIGSAVYTLPYVANRLNETYDTIIWVANADSVPVCMSIEFAFVPGQGSVGPGGKPKLKAMGPGGQGCQAGEYRVPVSGQVGFSPFISAPDPVRGLYPFPADTRDALLSAQVVARTGGLAIIAEGTVAGYSKRAAYEAFIVNSTGLETPFSQSYRTIAATMNIPFAIKSADGYYTQILVSNPSASSADVAIDYDDGNGATYRMRFTVPANGVDNHSVWADGTVPVGFVGTARITVLNDKSVAAVVFRTKMTDGGTFIEENLYTAVNAAPYRFSRSLVQYVPYAARRVPNGDPNALNSWVTVTPTTGARLSKLEVTAYGTTCATAGASPYFSAVEYDVSSTILYQNADTQNGFGRAVPCFEGWLRLTSRGLEAVEGVLFNQFFIAAASWIDGNAPGENEAVYLVGEQ
jgi:hypothetical protein